MSSAKKSNAETSGQPMPTTRPLPKAIASVSTMSSTASAKATLAILWQWGALSHHP